MEDNKMKLKVYKRTSKSYEDIFTKEKEVKEIHLQLGDFKFSICEHQLGSKLKIPHIMMSGNHQSYSIDLDEFIKHFKL
jgi:hypothetical protein